MNRIVVSKGFELSLLEADLTLGTQISRFLARGEQKQVPHGLLIFEKPIPRNLN